VRNFLHLASGIDTFPLKMALYQQPSLWDQVPVRTQTPGSPHAHASDVLLRFQPLDGSLPDHRECIWYEAAQHLPQVRPLVYGVMARMEGERLGRVMLARLEPGHNIPAHSDVGIHPLQYEKIPYWRRVHIVLETDPAVLFRCGDEVIHMGQGEVWAFRGELEHEVWWQGEGVSPRTHLILDVHTCYDPVV
jgi:hypothetical protein